MTITTTLTFSKDHDIPFSNLVEYANVTGTHQYICVTHLDTQIAVIKQS